MFAKIHDRLASVSLHFQRGQHPGLVVTCFHAIHADDATACSGPVQPFQPLTVTSLRFLVDFMLEQGFAFVRAGDIARGLKMDRACICLTFDDGYANNLRVLPVLKEFDVPATFFITTDQIETGSAFWWDALYRIRKKERIDPPTLYREVQSLKARSHNEILAYVEEIGGRAALRPEGDEDRPMTLDELRRLAADPLVEIGNHTAGHTILTMLEDDEVRASIQRAQDFLENAVGRPPTAIAYPNGTADRRIARIAKEMGLSIGFTVGSGDLKRIRKIEDPYLIPRVWVRGANRMAFDAKRLAADNFFINGFRSAMHACRR